MFSSKSPSSKARTKKPVSRKQRRKQERADKKQKKTDRFLKGEEVIIQPSSPAPTKSSPHQNDRKRPIPSKPKLSHSEHHESGLARLHRKRTVEVPNTRDDIEISRLEKLLKIKKKKLPTSFKDEGLDYILDLTDKSGQFDWGTLSSGSDGGMSVTPVALIFSSRSVPKNVRSLQSTSPFPPHSLVDNCDSEPKEISHPRKKQKSTKTSPHKDTQPSSDKTGQKRVKFDISYENDAEGSEYNEGAEGSNGYAENGDEGSDGWSDAMDESNLDGGSDIDDVGEHTISDAVDASDGGVKYVPPHMRLKLGDKDKEKIARLQKQVQGLVNRLSEANMKSITTQLEQLYREQSRNDMNSVLSDVLLRLCATAARLTDRFAMEHAMCVAVLHSHIGQDVGAFMVQKMAQRLDVLLKESPHTYSTKECSCVLMIIAILYNYRVIHCGLIYDIIRRLLEALSERNIELLLILLKHTGMEIRRDDASSLKDIILLIQQKAASTESPLGQSSRVKFMLETISALKTNNARKIPNYDPSLLEHMKKLLRGSIRSTASLDEGQLKVSFSDLLKAETHGRWWIVGSAWSGRDSAPDDAPPPQVHTETWVLELARRQRMTTDVRKTVFSVIMTSEDFADAFEKLVKLGLKEVQEREMIHVLLDCCLQERAYNPYYAFLGQKLCEYNHSHQVTFQYSLWDRFKVLDSSSKLNRANLIKLLSHLISTKALSIAVLRVVEFVELGPIGVKFYKSLLTGLLCDHREDTVVAIFARVTPLPHLKAFRDKLLVFMTHYLVKENSSVLLKERLEIVEKSMRTDGHLF